MPRGSFVPAERRPEVHLTVRAEDLLEPLARRAQRVARR